LTSRAYCRCDHPLLAALPLRLPFKSDESLETVNAPLSAAKAAAFPSWGAGQIDPFMTLSFMIFVVPD
jgi:adenine deaminase